MRDSLAPKIQVMVHPMFPSALRRCDIDDISQKDRWTPCQVGFPAQGEEQHYMHPCHHVLTLLQCQSRGLWRCALNMCSHSDQDTEDWCMHAVITNPKFPQSQVQCFPQLWWKLNQIYGLL